MYVGYKHQTNHLLFYLSYKKTKRTQIQFLHFYHIVFKKSDRDSKWGILQHIYLVVS